MLARIFSFIKRPTSRDVFINTLGTYLNIFFSALFVLILVRILSRSEYAVLGVLLGIAYVLANILDFGTTATIYSYFPILYEKRLNRLYIFVKSTFFYQSFFSFIILGILFIFFPFLDKVFFKTYAPLWELYLTAISVLFLIWQNFLQNVLYAAKKFVSTNIYLNVANLVKTAVLFILVFLHKITVGAVIFDFGILGPIIFFLLIYWEKKHVMVHFIKAEIRREEFQFGYTLTYFAASQFFNLGSRMDLFLLSFYRWVVPQAQVGDYAISQKIILTIIATIVSITQVLSPAFSKIQKRKDLLANFKTSLLYLLLPIASFVVLFFLPKELYTIVFTKKFTLTPAITRALSLPFIIYTLSSLPQLFILYTIKKPQYILITNVIFFVILTVGCFYLIPLFGVFGPPYAITAAFLISTLVLIAVAVPKYRKLPA